jgi:hypothetical protein
VSGCLIPLFPLPSLLLLIHLFPCQALVDAQRHPKEYGFEDSPALITDAATAAAATAAEEARIAKSSDNGMVHLKPRYLFAKAANHLYDHPFQMLIAMSAPIIGGFFYTEMQKPGKANKEGGKEPFMHVLAWASLP